MIRINLEYISRFIKYGMNEYIFPVEKGVYLAFDSKNYEYIGIEFMFLPENIVLKENKCNKILNELIRKDILIYCL